MIKKIISFLVISLACITSVFAGNAMTPDNYSFTIQTISQWDTEPPYIVSRIPNDGDTGVNRLASIVYVIADDKSGVNLDTITLRINGIKVVTENQVEGNQVTITYTPSTEYGLGEIINVTLDAEDNAN